MGILDALFSGKKKLEEQDIFGFPTGKSYRQEGNRLVEQETFGFGLTLPTGKSYRQEGDKLVEYENFGFLSLPTGKKLK